MTKYELLQLAAKMREIHGLHAENFATRMVCHFEAAENSVANVWRSVHECLEYVLPLPDQFFDWRQSAKARHLNWEVR